MIEIEINNLVKELKESYCIPQASNNILNLAVIQNYNNHNFELELDINRYPVYTDNYYNLINNLSNYAEINPENILLTPGSGFGLQLILQTFCNINTNVLIPIPNYPGFIHDVKLSTRNINLYNCKYINEDFIKQIVNNSIIYISSPNIPLGYVLSNDFIDNIKKYSNKLFIIDEAYFEYSNLPNYWPKQIFENNNLIIVRTFSKAFAAAGIRLGYVMANKELINLMKITYCTKSVSEFTINMGYKIIQNKHYYLNNIKNDMVMWNKYYIDIKNLCNKESNIYNITFSNSAPFYLLFCINAEYIKKIFLYHNILIRNKTDDMGSNCVRLALPDKKNMDNIINIIQKINIINIDLFNDIYIDIDKTIRKDRLSQVPKELVAQINKLFKTHNIKFITNNCSNVNELEQYLSDNKILYHELITPLKSENLILTGLEINDGYCIRNNKLYIFKFPLIDYKLFNLINNYKEIFIIEDDLYESSLELGFNSNINIPFIGSFLKLLDNDIKINIIGKQNMLVSSKNGIMIGDSNDDFLFAFNNNLIFQKVNNPQDTLNILLNQY